MKNNKTYKYRMAFYYFTECLDKQEYEWRKIGIAEVQCITALNGLIKDILKFPDISQEDMIQIILESVDCETRLEKIEELKNLLNSDDLGLCFRGWKLYEFGAR